MCRVGDKEWGKCRCWTIQPVKHLPSVPSLCAHISLYEACFLGVRLLLMQRNGITWTGRGFSMVGEGPGWLSELCRTALFCSPLNVSCPSLIPARALRGGKGLALRLWQMNRVAIRANYWEKVFSFSLLAQEVVIPKLNTCWFLHYHLSLDSLSSPLHPQ